MNLQETKPRRVAIPRHDTEIRTGKERIAFRRGKMYKVLDRDEYYTTLATKDGETMLLTETVDQLFVVVNLN